MRTSAFVAVLMLVPLAIAPAAEADTGHGRTVGVNLGYVWPGLWDLWYYAHPGGGATLSLSWEASLFPGADYDLVLYEPDAADDGYLAQDEIVARSATRTFAAHTETISTSLAADVYLVAVVPFQTQGERYTLSSGGGDLQWAGVAPGAGGYCPSSGC